MAAIPPVSATMKKESTDEDNKNTTKLVGSSVSKTVKEEPTDSKNTLQMAESSVSKTVKEEPSDHNKNTLKMAESSVKEEPSYHNKNTPKTAESSVLQTVKKEEPSEEVSRKVKKEATDEDEKETACEKELDLPLNKLNLGPKKKLIVLCLGGLLVDRVHVRDKARARGLRPDVVYGKFLVFKRPFCTEFLNFCFERFDVGLWSSARDHNIDGVLSSITGGMRSKLAFVWGQQECIDSGFGCPHKMEKPLFLKQLKDLWGKTYLNGKYDATYTLLVDDEPHTCLLNPPNTAIFPMQYKKHDPSDTFLGPNGEFRKYLDGLVDAKDVPYVKGHSIGQPAITPSQPNWDYYAKIVRRFGKKEDSVESSSK